MRLADEKRKAGVYAKRIFAYELLAILLNVMILRQSEDWSFFSQTECFCSVSWWYEYDDLLYLTTYRSSTDKWHF